MASIAKRADGRWRARYRDDAGREHAKHFTRKVDAQRWLDEVTASMVTGTYVDPSAGRITFSAWFSQWAARQVWESGTAKAMQLAAGSVPFASVPLRSLRRSHLESWVKQMQTAGLAPGTITTRYGNVRSVLRAAVRDRVIVSDPAEGVTLPRTRRQDAAMVLPTIRQVAALLDVVPARCRALVAVAAFAGLRLGEAAALQVGDIDFLRRTLRVSRQVQRAGGGKVEIRAPKYGSERTVYIPAELAEILAAHVRDYCPGADPGRWLFGSTPPHQNTVGHWWRQARASAGCGAMRLHDLRHFFASGLIAAGCDVVTVQRALGHKSATVTLATYAHLWPTAEDRTRQASAAMLGEVLRLADYARTAGTGGHADLR